LARNGIYVANNMIKPNPIFELKFQIQNRRSSIIVSHHHKTIADIVHDYLSMLRAVGGEMAAMVLHRAILRSHAGLCTSWLT